MKTVTCKECNEQVTKRQSLFVEELDGRICKLHEDVFVAIEQAKLDRKREELRVQEEAETKSHLDRIKDVVDGLIDSVRVNTYKRNSTIEEEVDQYREMYGRTMTTANVDTLMSLVYERATTAGPLTPEEIEVVTANTTIQDIYKMKIVFDLRISIAMLGPDVCYTNHITEFDDSELTIMDAEDSLKLWKECYKKAIDDGPMTETEINNALSSYNVCMNYAKQNFK